MTQHYTKPAKFFHWLTAALVAALFALGWYMTTLELSPLMLKLYSWHKWIGITVLVLTVLRLVWRLKHPAPAMSDDMSPLMRTGAHAGHLLLYALLIALPLIGWARSSSAGFPVVLFSAVQLPDLIGPNKELSETLAWLHWLGGWLFLFLIGGHLGAAIWHHRVKQDDTLVRMLPGRRTVAGIAGMALARRCCQRSKSWRRRCLGDRQERQRNNISGYADECAGSWQVRRIRCRDRV